MSACPDAVLETVAVNWPLIRDALVAEGFSDSATFLAAIATTYVETHIGDFTFKPIKEFGGVAYTTANYEDNREIARQLWNTQPGDGARYCGRGYIQITRPCELSQLWQGARCPPGRQSRPCARARRRGAHHGRVLCWSRRPGSGKHRHWPPPARTGDRCAVPSTAG